MSTNDKKRSAEESTIEKIYKKIKRLEDHYYNLKKTSSPLTDSQHGDISRSSEKKDLVQTSLSDPSKSDDLFKLLGLSDNESALEALRCCTMLLYVVKANEDLQWKFEHNVRELKDALLKIQELVAKVNILEDHKKNLDAQVEPLRLENEQLRRLTSKQSEKIEAYQTGSLTQDQTASLLQDVKALEQKLSNTQSSKAYFKEEWEKAVREIHRMKMEHQQALEVQIRTSKEELKNSDLEEMLCADSNALSSDQILLEQLRKEIDVMKPGPSFLSKDCTSQPIFGPIDSLRTHHSFKTHRSSAKSEEQDERLKNLIEERVALLKTGSYTNDDAIIVKLNTEIRSLLIQ